MNIPTHWLAIAGFSTLSLVAAGCSSSGGSSPGSAAGSGTTVSVQTVSGAQVLVDGSGRSLYFSDQEKAAHKVLCESSECQAIWMPLTVPAGRQPTGPAGVTDALTTIARPGGGRQLAYNGAPVYTFRFDHSAGDLQGDGQHDSFDGTDFTWEAATVSGAVARGTSTGNSYGNDGDHSGYGY
jgi:predicted lipoprotein with Yx(FWY)xxD motif